MSYCDSHLVDINDLILQSYQIAVITLSVIGGLFVGDHMMCSEFIGIGRYLYQLSDVSDTIVLVTLSPISYFRCQIIVVSYSVVRLSAMIDITSCWRY